MPLLECVLHFHLRRVFGKRLWFILRDLKILSAKVYVYNAAQLPGTVVILSSKNVSAISLSEYTLAFVHVTLFDLFSVSLFHSLSLHVCLTLCICPPPSLTRTHTEYTVTFINLTFLILFSLLSHSPFLLSWLCSSESHSTSLLFQHWPLLLTYSLSSNVDVWTLTTSHTLNTGCLSYIIQNTCFVKCKCWNTLCYNKLWTLQQSPPTFGIIYISLSCSGSLSFSYLAPLSLSLFSFVLSPLLSLSTHFWTT